MYWDFQLKNLKRRMKNYGDITQNARDAEELEELLRYFDNRVPSVIYFLEERVRAKGTQVSMERTSIRGCRGRAFYSKSSCNPPQKYIPPAFYDREGKFYQPPSFEMPVGGSTKTPERNRKDQIREPPLVEKNGEMRALS